MTRAGNFKLYKNVILGKNAVIEPGVAIGIPPFSKKDGELKTVIGNGAYIRSNTIIYAGTKIGDNFQTGPNVLIRENNVIGDNVVIWHGSTLNPENIVGDNSRIHALCFLEMVTLGKSVFLGPGVIFTDDPHPVIPINFRKCWGGAFIEDEAVIGANVTILPHIRIGKKAVVGAGSVVAANVASHKIVIGNPAKTIKDIFDLKCTRGDKPHFPYKK